MTVKDILLRRLAGIILNFIPYLDVIKLIDTGIGSLDPKSLDQAIRTLMDLQSNARIKGADDLAH